MHKRVHLSIHESTCINIRPKTNKSVYPLNKIQIKFVQQKTCTFLHSVRQSQDFMKHKSNVIETQHLLVEPKHLQANAKH